MFIIARWWKQFEHVHCGRSVGYDVIRGSTCRQDVCKKAAVIMVVIIIDWPPPAHTHSRKSTLYRPFSFAQSSGTWHQKTGTVLFPSAASLWFLVPVKDSPKRKLWFGCWSYTAPKSTENPLLLYGCYAGTWSQTVPHLRLISWCWLASGTKMQLVWNQEPAKSGARGFFLCTMTTI